MSLINKAEWVQNISTIEHTSYTILNTSGINAFTLVVEKFLVDENGELIPTNFNGERVSLLVSNDAWDTEYDFFDFAHVMLLPEDIGWIKIREINCGTSDRIVNGFEKIQWGQECANILH